MDIAFLVFGLIYLTCGIIFVVTYADFIRYYFIGCSIDKYKKPMPEAKVSHKFAVIIPAREESAVIEGLLKSIARQDYPKDAYDIFIAVEREDDPTCAIAARYGAEIYIKRDFTVSGKGYILREVTDYIFETYPDRNYDAFLIADADNILCDGFIAEMNKAVDMGYDVAVGKRNTKNWNDGWVAACTGITFVKFSRFQNFAKSRDGATVLLAGTGYCVRCDIVKDNGGWQWHSLTEDNELTMYSAIHNYKTTYCDDAVFLDEQPTDFKTSFNQRRRWVKGYFDNGEAMGKQARKGMFNDDCNKAGCREYALGIVPLVAVAVAIIVPTLGMAALAIAAGVMGLWAHMWAALAGLAIALASWFCVMFLDAYLVTTLDKKFIDLTPKNKFITVLMHPIFSALYIAVVVSVFLKPVDWLPIEHKVNLPDADDCSDGRGNASPEDLSTGGKRADERK